MSLAGNLRTMQLADILQWASQGRKTGTLVVDSGRITKRLYCEDGTLVASSSTQPAEQLGHMLVSHGYINEEELARAVGMQEETGMMLGKILVTAGGISEEELRSLLQNQAEEIVYDLFSWQQGEFRFVDQERIARGIIPLELSIPGVVMHGINRLDEWGRIRECIPCDRAVPVSMVPLRDLGLTASEQKILDAVNDDRDIRELCLETHASEYLVSRVLFEQVRAGRIKMVLPRESDAPRSSTTASSLPVATPEALTAAAEILIEEGSLKRALRYLRAARSLGPDRRAVLERVCQAEELIEQELVADGVEVRGIPVLQCPLEELTALELSPEEGFLISRIDGSCTMQLLLKISPIPRLDAMLVFSKLLKAGYISLEMADASSKKSVPSRS